jgi:DNA-binding NtrC family response regulator
MDAPCRILAVDDEVSVAISLRFIFAGSRYEVTCANNGRSALAELDVAPDAYDVIIVDQKMPNLSGVELVEAIRKRGIASKIIVVSAHLSMDVCEAYQKMDVSAMLPKPFNVEELRSVVDRLTRI